MKTTLDLSDALFQSAKLLAQQRKTTLRALVEEGLHKVVHEAQAAPGRAFKLADARVRGGRMLVADPRQWQALEDEHVIARVSKPSR